MVVVVDGTSQNAEKTASGVGKYWQWWAVLKPLVFCPVEPEVGWLQVLWQWSRMLVGPI